MIVKNQNCPYTISLWSLRKGKKTQHEKKKNKHKKSWEIIAVTYLKFSSSKFSHPKLLL